MNVTSYRPRSEASKGYVFTGICLSNSGGGGGRWATRSQHLPPSSGPGHNTSLPQTRSQHPPEPGHNTSLPPRTRSQHSPGPDHNTSLPPWTRSQHLPPSPPPGPDQVTTPPSAPPHRTCAGGRYASYWNAFLLTGISKSMVLI